jgi:transposase
MLQMSAQDRQRMTMLGRVKDCQLSVREAAEKLSISYRQCKRLWKRYREGGEKAITHRGRGVRAHNHLDSELKAKIVARYREIYHGFGPTLACEKLVEEDGLAPISRETLRGWLLEAGLWERQRRRGPYRKRREPMAHFGELVQMDGSPHRWFGEEHNECCLMNMVDDATKTTLGIMDQQETSAIAMRTLWAWINRYGIPMALYCDRKNVYLLDHEPGLDEQLEGKVPKSAFGAACEKLGIQIINAHSPQAKGRVERSHGVYQDRFVKELRLRGAKRIEEANMILQGGFTDKLNGKFAHPPVSSEDFHVPLRAGQDLRDIFCFEETRSVGRDWVVRFDNHFYQLLSNRHSLPRAGSKVTVRKWLDDSIFILHQNRKLHYSEFSPGQQDQRDIV